MGPVAMARMPRPRGKKRQRARRLSTEGKARLLGEPQREGLVARVGRESHSLQPVRTLDGPFRHMLDNTARKVGARRQGRDRARKGTRREASKPVREAQAIGRLTQRCTALHEGPRRLPHLGVACPVASANRRPGKVSARSSSRGDPSISLAISVRCASRKRNRRRSRRVVGRLDSVGLDSSSSCCSIRSMDASRDTTLLSEFALRSRQLIVQTWRKAGVRSLDRESAGGGDRAKRTAKTRRLEANPHALVRILDKVWPGDGPSRNPRRSTPARPRAWVGGCWPRHRKGRGSRSADGRNGRRAGALRSRCAAHPSLR